VYVCLCRGLTEDDVRRAARAGSRSAPALIADLELNDPRCCGRCARNIHLFVELAERELAQTEPDPAR
jgi:bacterioferritin-associated ferredoxin